MSDPGYNYANYVYFDKLDGMWKYSTLLSNLVGHCFTYLPMGRTMIGLNIYTSLVKVSIALISYFILAKLLSAKPVIVFIAELVALGYCWCPTALLYNYISYLLFTLAAIFICIAIKTDLLRYFFIAGICLGINVFVRLPNIAEVCLILVVWFSCIISKLNFKTIMQITLICVGGFACSVAVALGIISITFGLNEYFSGVMEIFNMPQSASNYSLPEMIRGDIYIYFQNAKWLSIGVAIIIPGMIGVYLLRKRSRIVVHIAYTCLNAVLIYVWYRMGIFDFTYYNYRSIENIGVFLLILSGLLSAYIMFFGGKNYFKRTVAATSVIIILVSPLGSNNYLFSAFNNLFFVLPFVFTTVYEYWRDVVDNRKNGTENNEKDNKEDSKSGNKGDKSYKVIWEPVMLTVSFLLFFASIQGTVFGAVFVFRDGVLGEKRTECINDIDALTGMYTQSENAEQIRELDDYIHDNDLKNAKVILYGDIPGIAFSLRMNPAISSTWPDLDSYSVDKFKSEICRVEEEITISERPIIISGIDLDTQNEKQKILLDYIEKNNYAIVFENEKYCLYR